MARSKIRAHTLNHNYGIPINNSILLRAAASWARVRYVHLFHRNKGGPWIDHTYTVLSSSITINSRDPRYFLSLPFSLSIPLRLFLVVPLQQVQGKPEYSREVLSKRFFFASSFQIRRDEGTKYIYYKYTDRYRSSSLFRARSIVTNTRAATLTRLSSFFFFLSSPPFFAFCVYISVVH